MERTIDIVSLYANDMNIYGDWGNIITITRRLALYGYQPRVTYYNPGDEFPHHVDMVLGGGGQDQGQKIIGQDLLHRGSILRKLADQGVPMLVVCGLYQLFGQYFQTVDGTRLEGIGVLDVYTQAYSRRLIGNVAATSEAFGTIIGYENHSGQTFLCHATEPLGFVGGKGQAMGNNEQDTTEGARAHHVIGTYLHGSLLPKNPLIADWLITRAVQYRYGTFQAYYTDEARRTLEQLDTIAQHARKVAAARGR